MSGAPRDPRVLAGMRRQLGLRRERLAAGETSLGWKLGFGTGSAMERLGTDAPLVGFLLGGALIAAGTAVSVAGWTRPVIEPEVAAYLGGDLPANAHREAVRNAIAAVGPAIELADLSFPPDDVEAILGGNIYQRHVVLGLREEGRAGGDLHGLVARVARDGVDLATTDDPQEASGDLLANVGHVANVLAAFGETLRAGEVVITGSIVPPIVADGPTEVRYTLDPIGSVSIRLTE